MNPSKGPVVMVKNNMVVTMIIKGKEVLGTIVDRGSGVNVISENKFDKFGICEWEPCPFWPRMVDTSSVQPTRLIQNLEITMSIHSFQMPTMVLQVHQAHIPCCWEDHGYKHHISNKTGKRISSVSTLESLQ